VLEHFLPLDAAIRYRQIAPYSFVILIGLLWTGVLGWLLLIPMRIILVLAGVV
jgi:hypothetical protein